MNDELFYSFEKLDTAKLEWINQNKRGKYHPKKTLEEQAQNIGQIISKKPIWTKINTFGYVFFDADFEKDKNKNIVLGEKYLAEFIKNDKEFSDSVIVFSKDLDDSWSFRATNNPKILLININRFNEFFTKWSNKDTINFFFFRLKSDEEKALFDVMVRKNYEHIMGKNELKTIEYLQNKGYSVNKGDATPVPILLGNVAKAIAENVEKYSKTLEEFKTKIFSKDENEQTIRKWLLESGKKGDFPNFWILGWEYLSYNEGIYGKNDVRLRKMDSHDLLIVEFKDPNDRTSRIYSTQEVLATKVHQGISQAIGYLCEENKKSMRAKAIVIIGRKREEIWEDKNADLERKMRDMNYFLHNIELITFEDLYERAQARLEFIKSGKLENIEGETKEEKRVIEESLK
ncbi:Uncharacterised protein [uncultured archaeon]|nr:Uncharacterised protein [uncultured archaeon]